MKRTNTIKNLKSRLSPQRVQKAQEEAKSMILNIKLGELRQMRGMKQEEIDCFSQSSISKIENRSDIKLSTLREYLHCIGMEIEIRARPKGSKAKKEEVILLKD